VVDEELIRASPLASQGLQFLAQSKVLLEQIERLKVTTLAGDSDESDEEVARKVKEFRRQSGMLLALQELGESLGKENQS
jgi:hypothetical protein